MMVGVSRTNTPTYDYLSTGDASDPLLLEVFLDDGLGGETITSVEYTVYLVFRLYSYTNISFDIVSPDTEVTITASLTSGSGYASSIPITDKDASSGDIVVPLYIIATSTDLEANSGVYTSADFQVTYDATL